jgi:hypothetical protein
MSTFDELRCDVYQKLRARVVGNYGEAHARLIELNAEISYGKPTEATYTELTEVTKAHQLQGCACLKRKRNAKTA